MNTEGKPIDSVIQYQLHRKVEGSGGGSGDSKIVFLELTVENSHICTQEDINNYVVDSTDNDLVLGDSYTVYSIGVAFKDLNVGSIYVIELNGYPSNRLVISYSLFEEGLYAFDTKFVDLYDSLENYIFYANDDSTELKCFLSRVV